MAKDDELKQLQADIKKAISGQSEELTEEKTTKAPMRQEATEEPAKQEAAEETAKQKATDGSAESVVSSADDVVEDKKSEEPDNAQAQDEEPKKEKKKGSIWNRILFIIGILMIAYAAYSIGSLYWNYHQSNAEYDDITQEFVTVNDDTVATSQESEEGYSGLVSYTSSEGTEFVSSGPWYSQISVNLSGLQSKYSDIAGWLYQEGGTAISYPIMYNEDDVYYLHKTYKGTYAYAGSIFMETLNDRDFNDSNTIIYGHNMRNGSMFGTLKYLRKDGYMDTHGYFQIFLEDEIRRYQVFAYEVVTSDSWVYQVPFGETEAFTEYINRAISNSEVDTGVEVTNQDHIIVLSTCYGTNTDKRFVVFAVWMDTYYYDTGMTQSEMDATAEDTVESDEDSILSDTEAGSEGE